MARKIETSAQLNKLLEEIARDVLEKVSEEVLKDFQEDYLMKYVYDVNTPKVYKRTMEFFNSWRFSAIKRFANVLETTMASDKSMIHPDADTFAHSWYFPSGRSSVEYLEQILNKPGRSSSHFWSRKNGAAYWDKFWASYVTGGKLQRVIDKHAKASGLVITHN